MRFYCTLLMIGLFVERGIQVDIRGDIGNIGLEIGGDTDGNIGGA